jgi:hypothetical protein
MQVSVAEAKDKLPQLIKRAESGERVTICRRGEPVARSGARYDGARLVCPAIRGMAVVGPALPGSQTPVTLSSTRRAILP